MFANQFKLITGHSPLSWQSRLFEEYFRKGDIPAAVDIPTGLGKTAIMALWLIARASGANLPRRLVYVVDRRAVVDQATDFAVTLRENLDKREALEMKSAQTEKWSPEKAQSTIDQYLSMVIASTTHRDWRR